MINVNVTVNNSSDREQPFSYGLFDLSKPKPVLTETGFRFGSFMHSIYGMNPKQIRKSNA